MPVYLFTFHGYMTWLPDHPRGYTQRAEGYQETDKALAEWYRRNAGDADASLFDDELMRAMIDETLAACSHQRLRLHAVTTETTHVHQLVSWKDNRNWEPVREGLKKSLSLRLKKEAGQAMNTSRRATEIKLS